MNNNAPFDQVHVMHGNLSATCMPAILKGDLPRGTCEWSAWWPLPSADAISFGLFFHYPRSAAP